MTTLDAINTSRSPRIIGVAAATTAEASIRFDAKADPSKLSVASFMVVFSQVISARGSLFEPGKVSLKKGAHEDWF